MIVLYIGIFEFQNNFLMIISVKNVWTLRTIDYMYDYMDIKSQNTPLLRNID